MQQLRLLTPGVDAATIALLNCSDLRKSCGLQLKHLFAVRHGCAQQPQTKLLSKMPLYEYLCRSCGRIFEVLTTSAAHQHEVVCLHCGSSEVQKQLSATSSHRSSTPQAAASSCRPGGPFR
ncbi:MAG: zinc ribbon domain-containing protein [Desulfobulbaceae bacterium]|nr:zinc ribbon domain-containing protein [Desulfobulbaceae bacterium]